MGFVVLWIESLAVSLLLMAWLAACVGRWRSRWRRALVWMPTALIVLAGYAYLATFAGIIEFSGTPGFHWFYYALSLAIAVLVGLIVLRVIGLKRTPDDTPATDPNAAPGLFTAIQEQLGLKLKAVKAPADVIVIDHVERPSAN